ncbi:MAG: M48 family metallopeptidase [Gammaproteobacteria bacterium]|nr:M48 family metallopeptidase [Gammaproteobacteria bacterium]
MLHTILQLTKAVSHAQQDQSLPQRRFTRSSARAGGRFRLLPVLLFAIYGLYYYFSNQGEVPLTGRQQLVDISREQEAALGLQSYQQILAQSELIRSGAEYAQVREIAARIAAAASDVDPGFDWEVSLIRSDQVNAFALPGGKLAVYTGILPVAENVDGLAVIMGHEIAHAIARHGAERMAYQKLTQLGSLAAGMSVSGMDPAQQQMLMAALGAGAQYGVLLPFSREHESEADYLGLIFLARACYDPSEAPALWQRMSASGGQRPPEFMSTHPSGETRIRQFQQWMPEALEIYRQRCQ